MPTPDRDRIRRAPVPQAPGPFSIAITAMGAEELQTALDAAETRAITASRGGGAQGILVTRIDPGRYLIELSDEVPFGLTFERDAWTRAASSRSGLGRCDDAFPQPLPAPPLSRTRESRDPVPLSGRG